MSEASPAIRDGAVDDLKHRLYVEDCDSFFQYQRDQFLSDARSGCNFNLNFVSKSGEMTSAHLALILPLSSHLACLVETSEACGCVEDVPTLLLPDWDLKVIEALVNLLYSGSVAVSGDVMEQVLRLMRDLRFDISGDQLPAERMDHSTDDAGKNSHVDRSLAVKTPIAQNNLSAYAVDHNGNNQKINWMKKIRVEDITVERKNEAQERVIKKLSQMLGFLEHVKIKNEKSLMKLSKPLDGLLLSWKYLPTEPSFNILPKEIQTKILAYLCNSGSFVAATVCHGWKEILNKKLVSIKELEIGKHCSNHYSCEDGKCFNPEELLKASIKLKFKINLKICHPIPNVDSKVVAESLTSVSTIHLKGQCDCVKDEENSQFLTGSQFQLLMKTLEEKNDSVEIAIFECLNMTHVDQDRLINCLLKIKSVVLSDTILDIEKFIAKLLQDSTELTYLCLGRLEYPLSLSVDLADALCLVKTIIILPMFSLTIETAKRLIENVFTGHFRITNFFLMNLFNWDLLMSHEELRVMLTTFERFIICGTFSLEQKEAARSLPGVEVCEHRIKKWSNFSDGVEYNFVKLAVDMGLAIQIRENNSLNITN